MNKLKTVEKYSYTYFLNKIPKSIVAKKGFAVSGKDLIEAKATVARKNITDEPLLCISKSSNTTLYFESHELTQIALGMLSEHQKAVIEKAKEEKRLSSVIKRFFGIKPKSA